MIMTAAHASNSTGLGIQRVRWLINCINNCSCVAANKLQVYLSDELDRSVNI